MSAFLTELKRTHNCAALRASDAGATVVLYGWVASRRDHGGCVFIDLRDREGVTQLVFEPTIDQETHNLAGELRNEFCIAVRGTVAARDGANNPRLATGEIEVKCDKLEIFSRAETPPFEIEDGIKTGENTRLKYRPLDLRRPELQKNFLIRSKIAQAARRYLENQEFAEIETPYLVKYTPGGARNFLVPCRLAPRSSTPWPNPLKFLSSCSWSPVSTATSKSAAVSAMRTCAKTGNPSSPKSTWS